MLILLIIGKTWWRYSVDTGYWMVIWCLGKLKLGQISGKSPYLQHKINLLLVALSARVYGRLPIVQILTKMLVKVKDSLAVPFRYWFDRHLTKMSTEMYWDRIFRVNLASILCRELYGGLWSLDCHETCSYKTLIQNNFPRLTWWIGKELDHAFVEFQTYGHFFVCKNKVLKMWLIPKHFYSLEDIIFSLNLNMLHLWPQEPKIS